MDVSTVSFSRKVSFGRFCNEEALATVKVNPDEDPEEAMARAREIVSKSLASAEEEREEMLRGCAPDAEK